MERIRVCLTGGIASGKTFVSDRLGDSGAGVIDADLLAREVVEPGTPGLQLLVDQFGAEILLDDGRLDRAALKKVAFADQDQLKILNGILHPLIREAFEQHSQANTRPIEIWVIPLYKANDTYQVFDRVLVIDVPESIQLQRIQNRDQVDLSMAKKIVASQPSRQSRLDAATDIIVNNSSFQALEQNTDRIFKLYQAMLKTGD